MSSGEHRLSLATTEPCAPPSDPEMAIATPIPPAPPVPNLSITTDVLDADDLEIF